jgi:L-threonylcarbamoyladenylate synthase
VKKDEDQHSPRWLKVEPSEHPECLQKAAQVIRDGGVVAFPTESFYGLAVNILDATAIQRLFTLKTRRPDQPILLLLPSLSDLTRYAVRVPPAAHKLIEHFWPGALTLIFEAAPEVSPLLTAGSAKIGLRLSSHPTAIGLAQACGRPITGTSANLSGQPACRDAQAVWQTMGAKVDLILDGGQTKGGLGSTILDVTVNPPLIVREGQIGRKEIEEVCAECKVKYLTQIIR